MVETVDFGAETVGFAEIDYQQETQSAEDTGNLGVPGSIATWWFKIKLGLRPNL